MATKIAERLLWAVETLAINPTDHLLEIGCGHGVAVSLICEQLNGGKITAIDRSATMVRVATRRNRRHVAAGKASFHAVALDRAGFGGDQFNKIFAVNVSLFWKQPAKELSIIKKLLTPGGALYLFHQPPLWKQPGEPRVFDDELTKILQHASFSTKKVLYGDLKPAQAVCIVARSP